MNAEGVLRDLRVAARSLRKSPGYALVVVTTLALGIAASTLIVSLANPYLIRQLPFAEPERLVQLGQRDPAEGWDSGRFSLPMLSDWKERSRSFEEIGAYYYRTKNVTGDEGPERIVAGVLSGNLFGVLGVEARSGRTFGPGEDGPGGDDVVVLSDGLWRRRYGADAAILGRTILLDGSPFTVIGIMPPEFNFPFGGVKMWIPSREDPSAEPRDRDLFIPVARLKPGVSRERARDELVGIQSELRALHPDVDGRFDGVSVKGLREALNFAFDVMRAGFAILTAAVLFVLAIACVNVAGLALARASLARREVAVRSALGASRAGLVRHLASEGLLLALTGGALGVLLAYWGARALGPLLPEDLFRVGDVRLDANVLAISMLTTLVTPLVFGLGPAIASTRVDLATALADSGGRGGTGRGALRFRRGLVVAEVAMALVLVAATGLLLRSLVEISRVDLGFRPERLLTVEVTLPESSYPEAESQRIYFERAAEELGALPPVRSVGTIVPLPMNHAIWTVPFAPPSSAPPSGRESWPVAEEFRVSPGAFAAMGIGLVSGRAIGALDDPSGPKVAVVSSSLAARYFSGVSPIGESILVGDRQKAEPATIIGVAADVVHEGFQDEHPLQIYRPVDQVGSRGRFLVVRTSGPPEQTVAAIRQALARVDRNLPVAVRPMSDVVRESTLPWSSSALLLGIFGLVALGLASLGVYGVVAYSVTARRREIGLRMALGATGADVGKAVVREGLVLGGLGLVIGLVLAAIAGKLIATFLFRVGPFDPTSSAVVVGLFLLLPVAASLLPALRAARIHPTGALRYE